MYIYSVHIYLYVYSNISWYTSREEYKSNDGSDPFSVSVEEQYLAVKTADHL